MNSEFNEKEKLNKEEPSNKKKASESQYKHMFMNSWQVPN